MIRKIFFLETWTIAITQDYKDIKSLNSCNWEIVKPNYFEFFADPSILKLNKNSNSVDLLYESINFISGKGFIKKLNFSYLNNKIANSTTLLKNNFHISFPNIFDLYGKEVLLYENEENDHLGMVEFNLDKNNKMVELPGKYLDPIILKINNDYLLIYSYRSNKNLQFGYKLISKDFTLKDSELSYSHNFNSIRNAGKIIYENGNLYRPGQKISGRYGEGIVFNELSFSDKEIKEKEYFVFKYDDILNKSTGLHTITIDENICVVDLRIQKFNPVALIIKIIRRIRKYAKR